MSDVEADKPLTKQQRAWFDAYTKPHRTDCNCDPRDPWRLCPWHDQKGDDR